MLVEYEKIEQQQQCAVCSVQWEKWGSRNPPASSPFRRAIIEYFDSVTELDLTWMEQSWLVLTWLTCPCLSQPSRRVWCSAGPRSAAWRGRTPPSATPEDTRGHTRTHEKQQAASSSGDGQRQLQSSITHNSHRHRAYKLVHLMLTGKMCLFCSYLHIIS